MVPGQVLSADLAGAHGAAGVVAGSGGDGGLPPVALFTGPPDFLLAAVGQVGGGEGPVAPLVPLGQQISLPGTQTVCVERFSHGILLSRVLRTESVFCPAKNYQKT